MSEQIHVIINPKTGTIEYEVDGVVGTSCTSLTDILKAGHNVVDEQLTQEYYTPEELPAWTGE